jgi:hypothetical protein
MPSFIAEEPQVRPRGEPSYLPPNGAPGAGEAFNNVQFLAGYCNPATEPIRNDLSPAPRRAVPNLQVFIDPIETEALVTGGAVEANAVDPHIPAAGGFLASLSGAG